ncbi:DUF6906 family protein [Enterococcus sp. LJL128]
MEKVRGKKPTRKIKEALSAYFGGCIRVNGANWFVIEENGTEVTCQNRKTKKQVILNVG